MTSVNITRINNYVIVLGYPHLMAHGFCVSSAPYMHFKRILNTELHVPAEGLGRVDDYQRHSLIQSSFDNLKVYSWYRTSCAARLNHPLTLDHSKIEGLN